MTKKVIILSGSARPGSVADKVMPLVDAEVASRDSLEAVSIDVNTLNLPFFNAPIAPSAEGYVATDENVKKWAESVASADAVILVTPEYNASMSAIQKNALDWLYAEWVDKSVALVGYGWHSGERAHVNARAILDNVKANVLEPTTTLGFMKDLNPDGTVLNQETVSHQLKETVDALVEAISE
ncbi:NAD(P)H-dependent oxidoreductase [Microbacteriaceae bacterium]|nr:NAD(P)H-dependent oxidoreductase [Candidatus Saccharibacteria bacterium]